MNEQRNHRKWTNLFLVRHGESTCNEVNRFAGSIDAPLTPLGEAQARQAARLWQGPAPEIIFTSPLLRARRTAEILFPHADPGRYRVDPRLSERHFGDFTLQNKAAIQRKTGLRRYEAALYGEEAVVPNGESFGRFHQRILDFLKEVLHPLLMAGKRVLVVAHKYVIELLCRMILRLPTGNGYDLRLPNGTILAGAELRRYIGREFKALNLLHEWIILRHAPILAISAVAGILLSWLQVLPRFHPLLPLFFLAVATGISLTRVDLRALRQSNPAAAPLLLRFVLLPLAIEGLFASTGYGSAAALSFLALLLAAPSAITGITISRCMGGMVAPTVQTLLLTTLSGTALMLPVLASSGGGLLTPSLRLLAVSGIALGLPILTVALLRRRFPIGTAKFGERYGAVAVVLLALFVLVSFSGIRSQTAWPAAAWAFLFAAGLRLLALALARRGSLFAVDNYVSMSYPNAFFVIVLAAIMGREDVTAMATWFLLPLFALAPLDEWLCRKVLLPREDAGLHAFLGIPPAAARRTGHEDEVGAVFPARSSAAARRADAWKPPAPEGRPGPSRQTGGVPPYRVRA